MATYSDIDKQLTRINLTPKAIIVGGAEGGVVAGLVLAVISMVANLFQGAGFFAPVYLIAATFLGESALDGGFFALLVGLVFHVFNSAVLGILFALITQKIHTKGALMATGALYGILVWAVMTYFALPVFNEIMQNQVLTNPLLWFVNHVIFGLVLSVVPYYERRTVEKSFRRRTV